VEANGILGADAKCEVDGNKPATGTYKAFLVDGVNRRVCTSHNCGTDGALENLNWVLKKNTKYIRISDSGEIFTTNNRRMFIFGNCNQSIQFGYGKYLDRDCPDNYMGQFQLKLQ
jgi:hypothetical protein